MLVCSLFLSDFQTTVLPLTLTVCNIWDEASKFLHFHPNIKLSQKKFPFPKDRSHGIFRCFWFQKHKNTYQFSYWERAGDCVHLGQLRIGHTSYPMSETQIKQVKRLLPVVINIEECEDWNDFWKRTVSAQFVTDNHFSSYFTTPNPQINWHSNVMLVQK